MTREEREKRIDNLKTQRFILNMKDRWNERDYEQDRKWENEIRELEKEAA